MFESDPILGNVIATYPSDRTRLLLPAGIIIGVVAIVLNFTVAAIDAWWAPPLTVILMGAISLVAGWPVLHLWNREVVLYDNGFSYREGGRTVYFLYHEIASLRQRGQQLAYFGGLIRRATFRFTLTTIRDERMVLTNLYRNIGQMGARIEAKVNPLLAPQIDDRLSRGEKVPFSDTLRLSREGLYEGGRELLWDSFAGYAIAGGRLSLLSRPDKAEWYSVPLGDVDNIKLLINLLKQRETTAANPEAT
ncbi:MAG: hypothetical protein K8I30_03390 [Anaerolineae bacterium]|nr:hypothetical protein [Anaerolineae bacterium]